MSIGTFTLIELQMDPGRKRLALLALIVLMASAPIVIFQRDYIRWHIKRLPIIRQWFKVKTVEDQIESYGSLARPRLQAAFAARGLSYPPARMALVAMKDTKELQVYAADQSGRFAYVKTFPILAGSGVLGPKLREGDGQVPEGIYKLALEPNTPYHLALRLNYPNEYDLARAKEDGREHPGSDILIHGSNCSIGCLAMGDPASEDLFVLAYDTHKVIKVTIAPTDLRTNVDPEIPNSPKWLPALYAQIRTEMASYPVPSN